MKTYINKKHFQFITDFSKHAYFDVNGKDHILDFGSLTINQRIMLSSYLTMLCNDSSQTNMKQNLYHTIFDFNSKIRKKTSYYEAFIDDISLFIKENPYFFAFIKSNFDKIVDNKTFIYRQQLNSTEMDVLYSLKFQRNYSSLMNVLYIIGVAKQNITTSALNKIALNLIYSNSSMAKKRVEEIFAKINSLSAKKIKWKIEDGYVYFGNGFEIPEKEEFYSEEKTLFTSKMKEEELLKKLSDTTEEKQIVNPVPPKKIEVKPEVKVNPRQIEEPEVEVEDMNPSSFEETSPFDLGDNRLTKEVVQTYIQNNGSEISNDMKPEYKTLLVKFANSPYFKDGLAKVLDQRGNDKDLQTVYNGGRLSGDDWQKRKDTATAKLLNIQNKTLTILNKLYDSNKENYRIILNYICRNFSKIFYI